MENETELERIKCNFKAGFFTQQGNVFIKNIQSTISYLLSYIETITDDNERYKTLLLDYSESFKSDRMTVKILGDRVNDLEKELHESKVMRNVNKDFKRITET